MNDFPVMRTIELNQIHFICSRLNQKKSESLILFLLSDGHMICGVSRGRLIFFHCLLLNSFHRILKLFFYLSVCLLLFEGGGGECGGEEWQGPVNFSICQCMPEDIFGVYSNSNKCGRRPGFDLWDCFSIFILFHLFVEDGVGTSLSILSLKLFESFSYFFGLYSRSLRYSET